MPHTGCCPAMPVRLPCGGMPPPMRPRRWFNQNPPTKNYRAAQKLVHRAVVDNAPRKHKPPIGPRNSPRARRRRRHAVHRANADEQSSAAAKAPSIGRTPFSPFLLLVRDCGGFQRGDVVLNSLQNPIPARPGAPEPWTKASESLPTYPSEWPLFSRRVFNWLN